MSEKYSAWAEYGMQQGAMYRYVRTGRTLYSDRILTDPDSHYSSEYAAESVENGDTIVYLENVVFQTNYEAFNGPITSSATMIKVLTEKGIIGWLYWSPGDWVKVS